eukprot:scaffold2379_cov124-Isochrysis_galbana.AAC.4
MSTFLSSSSASMRSAQWATSSSSSAWAFGSLSPGCKAESAPLISASSGETKEAVSAVASASSLCSRYDRSRKASSLGLSRGWIDAASCCSPAVKAVASVTSTRLAISSSAVTAAMAGAGNSQAKSSAAARKRRGAQLRQSWIALRARRVPGSREAPAADTADPMAPETPVDASAIMAWADASAAPASLADTVCLSPVHSASSRMPPSSTPACCTAAAAVAPSHVCAARRRYFWSR